MPNGGFRKGLVLEKIETCHCHKLLPDELYVKVTYLNQTDCGHPTYHYPIEVNYFAAMHGSDTLLPSCEHVNMSDTVVMKYQRLTSIKCSNRLKQCSDNSICVTCLQLASHLVGVLFDKTSAVKLSGVRKTMCRYVLQSNEKFL